MPDLGLEKRKSVLSQNVVHEVGLSEGLGNQAFLLSERGHYVPPGNFELEIGALYPPRRKNWPQGATEECVWSF